VATVALRRDVATVADLGSVQRVHLKLSGRDAQLLPEAFNSVLGPIEAQPVLSRSRQTNKYFGVTTNLTPGET